VWYDKEIKYDTNLFPFCNNRTERHRCHPSELVFFILENFNEKPDRTLRADPPQRLRCIPSDIPVLILEGFNERDDGTLLADRC
jgi:hypothetical protein